MPELLHGDPDLPHLDVVLWGYRASVFPGVLRLPAVGQALMTFARDTVVPHAHLFFVGHSMGGLVILDGLTGEARSGRATQRPASATRRVVLYASPVNGTSVASAIRSTVSFLPYIGNLLLSGHLWELGRGQYCDELSGEIVTRLYNPAIAPGDANSKVRVPIKAAVGARDQVVQASSAIFFFQNPGPSFFMPDDHFTVKEPENRDDPRYRALHEQLAEHYAEWFRERSRAAFAGDMAARIELLQRCETAAVTRLRFCPGPNRAADAPDRVEELLAGAMKLAVGPTPLDFGTTFNFALEHMVRDGR
jgi:hypothetical protein